MTMETLTSSNLNANAGMSPVEVNENMYNEINDVDSEDVIATKGTSTLDANEGIDNAKENKIIYNEIHDYENNIVVDLNARANANHVNTIWNNQSKTEDVAKEIIFATKQVSKLDANLEMNQAEEKESIYNEIDDVAKKSVITTNRTSTLSSKAETNTAKVKENVYLALVDNLYITLVDDRNQREDIRLPEVEAGNCSRVKRLRKPINVSIGLIGILALLAAGSIWLHTASRRQKHDLITDERTTFQAKTPDISKNISTLIRMQLAVPTAAQFIAGASDCSEVYRVGINDSGVYTITLKGQTVPVYCHMENGGGWTVFQNRMDGTVNFYNTWEEYKTGFGDMEGEFWWGNDHLATLTATKNYTLRVDMSDWDGDTAYALYTNFSVTAESDNYRLTAGGYNGTAGDSLELHSGQEFSTRDRDNDGYSDTDCAHFEYGGWWYDDCADTNPNGRYGIRGDRRVDVIYWWHWKRYTSLKTMSMKVKPTKF